MESHHDMEIEEIYIKEEDLSSNESENASTETGNPEAREEIQNLLPEKSMKKYTEAYKGFTDYLKENEIHRISEEVLLTYFNEQAEKYKPATLWAKYSMLKNTLNQYKKIDISSFKELIFFLKKQSFGVERKKSKVFSDKDMEKFITEADDKQYLLHKVIAIFGVSGALRSQDFLEITTNDVKTEGKVIIVTKPARTPKNSQIFMIDERYSSYVKKYIDLRPVDVESNRFFLCYRNSKCTSLQIGIGRVQKAPSKIASFLRLPKPDMYKAYSFRLKSSSDIVNSRAISPSTDNNDSRLGSHKENTASKKFSITPSSVVKSTTKENDNIKQPGNFQTYNLPGGSTLNCSDCTNCVINIYVHNEKHNFQNENNV